MGKGAAVRTGAGHAKGDYLVILDADLEYDPQDIPRLLEPVLDRRATVVYGSRTFGSHTAYSFWYVMGNKMVTMAANVLFNSYISDLETGYKLMPVDLYRSLSIRSKGFGMEAETTGKLLRSGIRPYEIPISYRARSREEGKKITWMDGVDALRILHAGARSPALRRWRSELRSNFRPAATFRYAPLPRRRRAGPARGREPGDRRPGLGFVPIPANAPDAAASAGVRRPR